jgi:AraC-like DNA-binding protein
MGLTALDLGLRGAVVGLFLVTCAVLLLRTTAVHRAAGLGAAMGVAGAAYAVSTAPFFPTWSFGWSSPIVALGMSSPVILWLWARMIFDEHFSPRPWHGAVWALMAGLGVVTYNGWTTWPALAATCGRLLAAASIAFALMAIGQTAKNWRKAMATARGRGLVLLTIGVSSQIVLSAAAGLAAIPMRSISLTTACGLGAFALLSVWTILFVPFERQPAVAGAGRGDVARTSGSLVRASPSPAERALLSRLEHLMTTQRTYRQEGLTIGLLAVKLSIPEYRLRTLVNDGLGYRNFNAFLNRYRIDEAKAALADLGQSEVPVLTIALDAGFHSLAPFNRAFKADTGLTPTEFRKKATAEAQSRDADAKNVPSS